MSFQMTNSHLQFKQALLETTFTQSTPRPDPMYDIPEGVEDSPSFFFPFYQIFFNEGLLVEPVEDEAELPAQFRTYDRPLWDNWTKIWNASPIELDTNTIPNPVVENLYQSTLFRLQLDSTYFFSNEEIRIIRQGTTITFKGYDHEDVRFVVEWLQWIHNHTAYLKVVAMTSNRLRIPYTDPDYPSFILTVPLCLVQVPIPSSNLTLHYSLPLDKDDEAIEAGTDVEFCWVCSDAF